MANDLNAQKGGYVASDWKDGVGEGEYTPITPAKLNHIEQGIQSNSEDLKKLGDAWDSASSMFGTTQFSFSSQSVPANGNATFTASVYREGYVPIGLASMSTMNEGIVMRNFSLNDRVSNSVTLSLQLRNLTSSASSTAPTCTVFYIRSEFFS